MDFLQDAHVSECSIIGYDRWTDRTELENGTEGQETNGTCHYLRRVAEIIVPLKVTFGGPGTAGQRTKR